MNSEPATPSLRSAASDPAPESVEGQDGSPREFVREGKARYERRLVFDKATDPATASPRKPCEGFARPVRDVLARRWVQTESTYARENPKRVFYMSMEFLIGRSLANNVTSLLLASEALGNGREWPF